MQKKKLLTAEELSRVLGISEITVKKLAKSKELPCVYVNRQLRFSLNALLRHFKRMEGGAA
jgi:excisionase family DNA binding protein